MNRMPLYNFESWRGFRKTRMEKFKKIKKQNSLRVGLLYALYRWLIFVESTSTMTPTPTTPAPGNYMTCVLVSPQVDYASVEALALICGMSHKGQWPVWGGCARVASHAYTYWVVHHLFLFRIYHLGPSAYYVQSCRLILLGRRIWCICIAY